MNAPIDYGYFGWLYSLVGTTPTRRHRRSHRALITQLHDKSFRWFIRNDDNRCEDGRDLRDEYVGENLVLDHSDPWMQSDVSMLEMLIALSRRIAFESYSSPKEWFWKLLDNLGLENFTDEHYNSEVEIEVDEVLEQVLNRSYHPSGMGGLFPLRNATHDQRRVELWYQMAEYLAEGEEVANGP